jgi:hypothetical protein
MKRSAAIIGPTPAFLRWSLTVECPFRDTDAKSLPDAAFRELRSLRAIAVGEVEERIFDGICVHPAAADVATAEVKGFPVQEVYHAYGGSDSANSTCQNCVANVPISQIELEGDLKHSKAGCFGWLPFGDHIEGARGFSQLMVSGESSLKNIVEEFEAAAKSVEGPCPFPRTDPLWYGVWSCGDFSAEQLKYLVRICEKVESKAIAWQRVARAVKLANDHDVRFVCALTPPGNSNGTHWRIESHCLACGFARTKSPCRACGELSPPQAARKTKVLGLRPYLNLVSIIGKEATVSIVERYRCR